MKYILLFATLFILAGTACKKSKKEVVNPDFLSGGTWTEAVSSLYVQPYYKFNAANHSYAWFPGGYGVEETGTYQLRTTSSPNIFELSFTQTGTTTPYVGALKKISGTMIEINVNGKTRLLNRF